MPRASSLIASFIVSANMAAALLSAMTPDAAYDMCVDFVKTGGLDGKGTGAEAQADKLKIYKFFKQVTAGDMKDGEARPSLASAVWKAGGPIAGAELLLKWDAWSSVKGTSCADAKKGYVETLIEQCNQFGRDDALAAFIKSKS